MSLPLTNQPPSVGASVASDSRAGWRRPLVGVGVAGVLVGAGAANGAYFPGSWGWIALACAWLGALALFLDDEATLSRGGLAFAGLLAAVAGWTLLSAAWSVSPTETGLEAERALMYVAAALALLVAGRRAYRHVLTGTWAAIVLLCGWGLLTRLLPERLGVNDAISGYRLSSPIGYWNSLGLLAAMGILLALGLAVRRGSLGQRALAAASITPLASTLYFTFSRGAWIALAAGLVVAVALDRRRLQLLVVGAATGVFAAAGVAIASQANALITVGARLADRSRDGHRLLLIDLVLSALAAVALAVCVRLDPRVELRLAVRRRLAAGLLAVVLAGLSAVFAGYGAPWTLVARGWHQFSSSPSGGSSGNLNGRLFHLTGSGRVVQWGIAWRNEAAVHPLLGSGAGTYDRYWTRYRPSAGHVQDVHNLYLEALAEQGPVGLALLVAALLVPLALAWRARRRRLVPFAVAAFVAYLLHAIVDWDWEVGAVTLAALACGAAVVLAAGDDDAPLVARRGRAAILAVCALCAGLAVWTIAGRIALARSSSAVARGDWVTAAKDARRAATLQPWSAEPWQRLGEAQLAGRRYAEARVSLRKALALDPGNWLLWLRLAEASDGRPRAAALDRARALSRHSAEIAAYVQILRTFSGIGPAPRP